MPRLADHEQRRGMILDALLRIAGDRGLHAASMRTVAAEAGVTVSTVQYYFHSKEQLLFAGLERLAGEVAQRASAALAGVRAAGPRAIVRAWLAQMIPADDDQRTAYTVFAAYHALALTDPALAAQPYSKPSGMLEQTLAQLIRTAQEGGALDPARDAEAEAVNLLALATGLGDGVMGGLRDAADGHRLLDYHLEHLFTPSA